MAEHGEWTDGEAAKRGERAEVRIAGLVVRGFVLSQTTPETDPSAATNAEVIQSLTGLPCLGELPDRPTTEALADALTTDGLA